MAGKTVDTIQLELDDLLDKSHSNNPILKLENVTLDVNLTLHLLNRYFFFFLLSFYYAHILFLSKVFLEERKMSI